MIQTKDLAYTYTGGASIVFPDISCAAREMLLILGASGIGKTTLLHLLGGILRVQQGNILIDTTDISSLSGAALDHFRGQNIGIVFQQNHFVEALNVLENVLLAQSLAGRSINKEKALKLLKRLNIDHKAGQYIRNLSQGEKQRVAIARALINDPKIVLADELTSALDDDNCTEVLHLLQEQAHHAGSALIIVTHDTRLKDKIDRKVILERP
ncbi:MAG: ABC transporter ATP-binding protein [Chitinophagales bacterium]|nr:ABC transporter ATP-binding protein [Chitinophagales bacterium]